MKTLRWPLLAAVVVLLALIQAFFLADIGAVPLPSKLDWLNVDWLWYRDGMERVLSGQPLYDPRLLAGPYNQLLPDLEFTWNQAPSALAVVAPFYLLPEALRSSAFFIFSTSCALGALWLAWPRGWSMRWQVLLAIALAPAMWAVIYWANLITLAGLGVALTWVGRRRNSTAMMTVGLFCAGVVKIYPAVLIGLWLLTRRRFAPVLLALAFGILSVVPAIVYGGPQILSDFLTSQTNALSPVASTNLAPRIIAYRLGVDLPQFVVQLTGIALVVIALLPRRRPETSWLLLQLAVCCFVANLWIHWPFPALLMAVAWLAAHYPRLSRFETWLRS